MRKSKLLLFLLPFLVACAEDYTPKPKGYPRIDLPDRAYITFESDCPYSFEVHERSIVSRAKENSRPCWLNIDYPQLNCRIHLSYVAIDGNLNKLLEDSRNLVYKHTIKASAINQRDMMNEDARVYSRIFEIEGDAASSVQFYSTDSSTHFVRGALYFNAASNADSLRPAIDYVREDVNHLVKSLKWQ